LFADFSGRDIPVTAQPRALLVFLPARCSVFQNIFYLAERTQFQLPQRRGLSGTLGAMLLEKQ
jgi:hypothetical protein